jgi:hypothetical protein
MKPTEASDRGAQQISVRLFAKSANSLSPAFAFSQTKIFSWLDQKKVGLGKGERRGVDFVKQSNTRYQLQGVFDPNKRKYDYT